MVGEVERAEDCRHLIWGFNMSDLIPSFFDEMEKISAINPLLVLGALSRADATSKGSRRHKEMMRAVEQGYPVGWVPLGMRPHGSRR